MNADLCEIMVAEMQRLEFSPEVIAMITSNHCFIEAQGKEPHIQRVHLTRLLYRIMMTALDQVPTEIRMATTFASDWLGWSEDLKLTVLPFLRINIDKFFVRPLANF